MGGLIVEAVSNEAETSDVVGDLLLFVSVSQAADGGPVTGLTKENFRITSSIGIVLDPFIGLVSETNWEPDALKKEPSGCYSIWIGRGFAEKTAWPEWVKGELYAFGIQVRTFKRTEPPKHEAPMGPPKVIDKGQTVISVKSLGR